MDGPDGEAYFRLLEEDRAAIETSIGASLEWSYEQERKQNYINLYRSNCDLEDRTQWPTYHLWLKEKLELFDDVFRPRIKSLNAAEYVETEDEGELEL